MVTVADAKACGKLPQYRGGDRVKDISDRQGQTEAPDNAHSLRSEELAAQRDAVIGRTIALIVISVLVTYLSPWPAPLLTYALLSVFVLIGWMAWHVAKAPWGRAWHQYVFVSLDFAILTFTLLYPNPLIPFDYPPQFALRYGGFIYFFVLLAGLAYVYQPRLVLWGGVSAALSWSLGVAWLMRMPESVWVIGNDGGYEEALDLIALPTFIDFGVRLQEVAVFMIAAGLLALAVRRARRVALRQASLARQRENLGRYFPRKTAQLLAERADPFSSPSETQAVVLFADLVSFTSWSENHTPKETIELLRKVHGALAEVVFRHGGTLDKFIGDGLMATFGTPEASDRDASNALAAMVDMVDAFEAWKQEDSSGQSETLQLAVGAHYGPVVIGNIGSAQRLEFAVLGDTVNVASRLEGATREVGCTALASEALILAAESEGAGISQGVRDRFALHGRIDLRGRGQGIKVYAV